MKRQWGLIFSLIFALIIAIFSVINVNVIKVNYLFGTAQWPLILVILSSVLMGALLVGSFGIVRMYRLQRQISRLKKQIKQTETVDEKSDTSTNIAKETSQAVPSNVSSDNEITPEQQTEKVDSESEKDHTPGK